MTLSVRLPAIFRLNAIDKFTQEVVTRDGRPSDKHIVLDFSRLDFIDGSGYTVLSNTIGWLKANRVRVDLINYRDLRREGIKYLDCCGFFRQYVGGVLSRESEARSTTLPCTSIKSAQSFFWIDNRLSPWLGYILDVPHSSLSSIRTCVKELFNNISDHAAVDTGYVHAQQYPNIRTLKITVSDFGVGIPATIRKRFGAMSDAEAIRLAAEEGVTSQSRPNNMGAGLNFLIDCVAGNNGSVLIHSLGGSIKCYVERGIQVRRPVSWKGSYPGTLVEISLDTRLFVGDDDDRGEVQW